MKETNTKSYVVIFAILIALLGLNFTLSQRDLGCWGPVVTVGISCVQAFLLAAYFMHLRESPKLNVVFALSGFFFLAILVAFVVTDNAGRARQLQQSPISSWEQPDRVTLPAAAQPAK